MGQLYNLGSWIMFVWVIIAAVYKLTQRFQRISLSSWQLFEVGNRFLYYIGKEPKPREVKIISLHEKSVRKRALLSLISDSSSAPHTRLLRWITVWYPCSCVDDLLNEQATWKLSDWLSVLLNCVFLFLILKRSSICKELGREICSLNSSIGLGIL